MLTCESSGPTFETICPHEIVATHTNIPVNMMRVIAAHLHALHKKLRLVGPTIGFRQKIVNGNEPQRVAQVKNGQKPPENAVFGLFRAPKSRFSAKNRPISKNFSHKGTKTPSGVLPFSRSFASWRLGVRRLPDRSPSPIRAIRVIRSEGCSGFLGSQQPRDPNRSGLPSPFVSFVCFMVKPPIFVLSLPGGFG